MAKFLYKMQNILNIKYKLEEQAKTAFGIAQRKLAEEEKILEKMEQRKLFYQEETRKMLMESLDILKINQMEMAIENMKETIKLQKVKILDARHRVELARERLKETMVERKTHEKLRENAFEEFKQEINQQEKKEVDELVSYKYSRPVMAE